MDPKRFSGNSPGSLKPITGGEVAFVPFPLPPRWELPARLWPLVAEARQQLGTLEGIGRSLPNPAILLRPLEDREAIRSSRLEGTYVTARELLLFEMEPRESETEGDARNDQREVFNYRVALVRGTTTDLPLSLRLLRQLHETLLTGVRGQDKSPGQFRRVQVAIGRDHRFVPPPPEQVLECLDPLEKYLHAKNSPYDPLVDCFLVHYQFETIHPFRDGNGRVGRLLLAIMLMRRCGLSKPWLHMSEYFEGRRDEYIERLFNVSATGDWDAWIEYCLTGTVSRARDTIERCQRLRTIRDEYVKKVYDAGGSIRLGQIVENLFSSPFVRIADLRKTLHVTYPTAAADVRRLEDAGILRELDGVSPKTYYAPEVFDIAYEGM